MSSQSVLTQIQNGFAKYVPIQSLNAIRNLNPNTITLPEPYFNPENNQIAALNGNLFVSNNGEFIQVGNIVVPPIPVDLSNISGNNLSYVNGNINNLNSNLITSNIGLFNVLNSNVIVSNTSIFNTSINENIITNTLNSNTIVANIGVFNIVDVGTLSYDNISANVVTAGNIVSNVVDTNIVNSNIVNTNDIVIDGTYKVPRTYFGVIAPAGTGGTYPLILDPTYSTNVTSITGTRIDNIAIFADTVTLNVGDTGGSIGKPTINITSIGTVISPSTTYVATTSISTNTISFSVIGRVSAPPTDGISYSFNISYLNP